VLRTADQPRALLPRPNVSDGFGILPDEDADRIREQREAAKTERKERMQRLGESE
jgi:hypothetical protein